MEQAYGWALEKATTLPTRYARALIKFDLSSIPANAVITSATLSLWTANDLSDNTRTIRVYHLKRAFNESQPTWNLASTGVNWEVAGAPGVNDRESTDIGSLQILASEALNTEKQISLSTAQIDSSRVLRKKSFNPSLRSLICCGRNSGR